MSYYESFKIFWIDIYKKQYFKVKVVKDYNGILTIKENIWRNIHLTINEKKDFWKTIGGVE